MDNDVKDEEHIEELDEDRLWPHDPDGPSWAPMKDEEPEPKKRGRRKIPEKWTRVISVSHDKIEDLAVFDVTVDIETKDERLYYPRRERSGIKEWKLLFHPK